MNKAFLTILIAASVGWGADILFVGNSVINEYPTNSTNIPTAYNTETGTAYTYVRSGVNGATVDNVFSRFKTQIDTGHFTKVIFEGALNDLVWVYAYYKATAPNIQLNNVINGILLYYSKAKALCDAKSIEFVTVETTPWGYTGTTAAVNKLSQDAGKAFNCALRDWCIKNNAKFARVYLNLAKSQVSADKLVAVYAYSDSAHLSSDGYTRYGTILARATVPTSHRYTFGTDSAQFGDHYKINQLRLNASATINGDSGTGSIVITNQGSIYTPVLCSDQSTNIDKYYTVTANATEGSFKLYYRGASDNFSVDTTTEWTAIDSSFTCSHRFYQLKLLADSSCTITDLSIFKTGDAATGAYNINMDIDGNLLPSGTTTVVPVNIDSSILHDKTDLIFKAIGNSAENLCVYDGATKLKCYVTSLNVTTGQQKLKMLVQCATTAGSNKKLTIKINPTYNENNFNDSVFIDEKYILSTGLDVPKDRCLLQGPVTYPNAVNYSIANGKDNVGMQLLNPSVAAYPHNEALSDTPKLTIYSVFSKPHYNQNDVMLYVNGAANNFIMVKTENDSLKVFFVRDNNWAIARTSTSIFTNNLFYFLVVRFDGTYINADSLTQNRGRMKMYVGDFIDTLRDITATITYSGNVGSKTPYITNSTQLTTLGFTGYSWDGIIDEFRLQLDAPEVKNIDLAYRSFMSFGDYKIRKSTIDNKSMNTGLNLAF